MFESGICFHEIKSSQCNFTDRNARRQVRLLAGYNNSIRCSAVDLPFSIVLGQATFHLVVTILTHRRRKGAGG